MKAIKRKRTPAIQSSLGRIFFPLFFIPLLAMAVACGPSAPEEAEQNRNQERGAEVPNPDPAHNSRISLDWDGTYHAVLAGDTGDSLKATLIIDRDGAYEFHLSPNDGDSNRQSIRGHLVWEADGNHMTLTWPDGSTQRYQVMENRLKWLGSKARESGKYGDQVLEGAGYWQKQLSE